MMLFELLIVAVNLLESLESLFQVHDSFRAFRSQNLNVSLALETKPAANTSPDVDCPVALLYGSTLR